MIKGQISDDEKKQAPLRNQLGRFILATNDTDNPELIPQVLLDIYPDKHRSSKMLRADSVL